MNEETMATIHAVLERARELTERAAADMRKALVDYAKITHTCIVCGANVTNEPADGALMCNKCLDRELSIHFSNRNDLTLVCQNCGDGVPQKLIFCNDICEIQSINDCDMDCDNCEEICEHQMIAMVAKRI